MERLRSTTTSERVEFEGHDGSRLAGRLDRPPGPARATALFAHCFTCGKDLAPATRIARRLAEQGVAVLRFDFTGLGSSEGEFANTTFRSNAEDLVCAADWLREHVRAPSLLVGHSLGGAAVLAAAHRIPEAAAVATLGAPAEPDHVRRLLRDSEEEIERRGEGEVEIAGRRFRIRREFLDVLRSETLTDRIRELRRALLVLHAPLDDVVGIDNATRIFLAARHPKSFVSLDDADHLLSRPEHGRWAAEVIGAWARRYLPARVETQAPRAAPDEVVVVETGEGRFAQLVQAGPHTLLADEPESLGGTDTGPTPYGLLLAALGTCTSMTLRLYAERKGIALDAVRVRLRHEKIHARDCEECETRDARIDRIERTLELDGDLDEATRRRLAEIADRCPVHRTLEGEVLVETRLEEPRPAAPGASNGGAGT